MSVTNPYEEITLASTGYFCPQYLLICGHRDGARFDGFVNCYEDPTICPFDTILTVDGITWAFQFRVFDSIIKPGLSGDDNIRPTAINKVSSGAFFV